MSVAPFELGNVSVAPGRRAIVEMPAAQLYTQTPLNIPVHVVHGREPGPVLLVCAAIHGDELNGVEIIRRLLRLSALKKLRGTLIAVPVVNVFGFIHKSRYLPDRRDLNRVFPGHSEGSLAARLAELFMTQVVRRCDVGIDLHSAAVGRENFPQIRLTPGSARLRELGDAFAAPVTMISKVRDGSLRLEAGAAGVDVLLYEAGEGLRFDEFAARAGVAGILRVMEKLDMIPGRGVPKARGLSVFCERSAWVRAPSGGLLRTLKGNGEYVDKGTVLGIVTDPFGEQEAEVRTDTAGIVIGRTNLPVVNEGDALFHIAQPALRKQAEAAADGGFDGHLDAPALFDEDEII